MGADSGDLFGTGVATLSRASKRGVWYGATSGALEPSWTWTTVGYRSSSRYIEGSVSSNDIWEGVSV